MAAQFNYFLRHNNQVNDSSEQKEIEIQPSTEADAFHHFITTIEFANISAGDHSYKSIQSMQLCLNNHIEISTLLNYLIDCQSLDERMDQWSNILLCIKWLISYYEDINKHQTIKTHHSNIYEIKGIEYKYSLLHVAAALSEIRLLQKFRPKSKIKYLSNT